MNRAVINVSMPLRRILTKRQAADYCNLNAKRFANDCAIAPIEMPDGSTQYDIQDLDKWIDSLKAGSTNDDDIIARLGK